MTAGPGAELRRIRVLPERDEVVFAGSTSAGKGRGTAVVVYWCRNQRERFPWLLVWISSSTLVSPQSLLSFYLRSFPVCVVLQIPNHVRDLDPHVVYIFVSSMGMDFSPYLTLKMNAPSRTMFLHLAEPLDGLPFIFS